MFQDETGQFIMNGAEALYAAVDDYYSLFIIVSYIHPINQLTSLPGNPTAKLAIRLGLAY